jgi:hypothetical protein
MNVRYWPVADTQIQEIMVVRAAASDPKRTFTEQQYCRKLKGCKRLRFQHFQNNGINSIE